MIVDFDNLINDAKKLKDEAIEKNQKQKILAKALLEVMDELRDRKIYDLSDKLREALRSVGYEINNCTKESGHHRLTVIK